MAEKSEEFFLFIKIDKIMVLTKSGLAYSMRGSAIGDRSGFYVLHWIFLSGDQTST